MLMLPFLAIAGYSAMIAGGALSVVSQGWNIYQNVQRMKENERYWNDYYQNTGVEPLYPYRAGSYNDYVGTALSASQGVINLYSRYGGKKNDY